MAEIDAADFTLPAAPTFQGRGGRPLSLPAAPLAELGALDREPEGLRSLVGRHGKRRVPPPFAEVLGDINLPEDWRVALESGMVAPSHST